MSTQHKVKSQSLPHWSRIVEVGLLSDPEANTMIFNESSGHIDKLDSIVARGKDWAYTPLCLECIAHFCSAPALIFDGCGGQTTIASSTTASLMKRLTMLSKQSCKSEEERTLFVVEEGLRHLFSGEVRPGTRTELVEDNDEEE